jgi:hypothetical protein
VRVVDPTLCRRRRQLETVVTKNKEIHRFLPQTMLYCNITFVIEMGLLARDAVMHIASIVGMKASLRHPRLG